MLQNRLIRTSILDNIIYNLDNAIIIVTFKRIDKKRNKGLSFKQSDV
jgi:hypothetical protein